MVPCVYYLYASLEIRICLLLHESTYLGVVHATYANSLVFLCHYFFRRPSAHLKSNPKFHGLDLSSMILPAKALRSTILNTRDRDQWLSGRFAIVCLRFVLLVAKLPDRTESLRETVLARKTCSAQNSFYKTSAFVFILFRMMFAENHKIQMQDHGLSDTVDVGTRAIDHHLIAGVIAAVSGKQYSMKATFPYGHEVQQPTYHLFNAFLYIFSTRFVHELNLHCLFCVVQVYSETLEGCAPAPVSTFAEALQVLRKNKASAALKIHINNLNRSVCTILSNEIAKVNFS
jgi:hypothetical protein